MYYGWRNGVTVQRLVFSKKCIQWSATSPRWGKKGTKTMLLTSCVNKTSQYQEEFCLSKPSDAVVSVVLRCCSCLRTCDLHAPSYLAYGHQPFLLLTQRVTDFANLPPCSALSGMCVLPQPGGFNSSISVGLYQTWTQIRLTKLWRCHWRCTDPFWCNSSWNSAFCLWRSKELLEAGDGGLVVCCSLEFSTSFPVKEAGSW